MNGSFQTDFKNVQVKLDNKCQAGSLYDIVFLLFKTIIILLHHCCLSSEEKSDLNNWKWLEKKKEKRRKKNINGINLIV